MKLAVVEDDPEPRGPLYGRIWPKLVLAGVVGLTVAVGVGLKLLLG